MEPAARSSSEQAVVSLTVCKWCTIISLASQNECIAERETAEAVFLEIDQGKLLEERLSVDKTNILMPFTLKSERNSYILPGAHNFQGWNPLMVNLTCCIWSRELLQLSSPLLHSQDR
jgi:hypothetical protein